MAEQIKRNMADTISHAETLVVPAQNLQKFGFGVVLDGSLLKVAYTTEKDIVNGKVHIHLASFPRTELDAAVCMLSDTFGGKDTTQTIGSVCGLSASALKKKIEKELAMCVHSSRQEKNVATAFTFLANNLSLEEITHPASEEAAQYVGMLRQDSAEMMRQFMKQQGFGEPEASGPDHSDPEPSGQEQNSPAPKDTTGDADENIQSGDRGNDTDAEGDVPVSHNAPVDSAGQTDSEGLASDSVETAKDANFPTLLILVGADLEVIEVQSDGSFVVLDRGSLSVKTFMGLGCLLTGAQTYAELLRLAKQGDAWNVDVYAKHLKNELTKDVYSLFPDNAMFYNFGQGVDKNIDDFSREDLAAGALSAFSSEVSQTAYMACMLRKPDRVFFCLDTPDLTDHLRMELTKIFMSWRVFFGQGLATQEYFLKHDAYLGAIGALLDTIGI